MRATEAKAVLEDAVDAYRGAFGRRFLAAYALGSLAHGGFSPLVSDVDLGLIVDDPVRSEDAQTVQDVARAVQSSGSALAQRLSVFWGTPATLQGQGNAGRFPTLDRLDLIDSGRLLAGVEMRSGLSRPSRDELLVGGAEFALETLGGEGVGSGAAAEDLDPERLFRRGVRRMTKVVLFPVRFMFTAATGRVGMNQQAVAWYLAREGAPAAELVAAGLVWRDAAPADDEAAIGLLGEQLVPLYLHYLEDHRRRLAAVGQRELARAFERWHARLGARAAI